MDCLPVRPLIKYHSGDGAWVIAQKADQRKRFKAIICALKSTEENCDSDIDKTYEETLKSENEYKFSKELILEHCRTVDPNKIAVINVSFRDLTSSQDEFYEFSSVYKIDASKNHLNLDNFITFLSLVELNLSSNNIRNININPDDFENLQILDLSFNNLHSEDILMLGLLKNLKILIVTGNNLRKLPFDMGQPFTNGDGKSHKRFAQLEELNLEHNHLGSESTFSSLGGLQNLKILKLAHNDFEAIPLLRYVKRAPQKNDQFHHLHELDIDEMEEEEDFRNLFSKNINMEVRIPSTLHEEEEEDTLRTNFDDSDIRSSSKDNKDHIEIENQMDISLVETSDREGSCTTSRDINTKDDAEEVNRALEVKNAEENQELVDQEQTQSNGNDVKHINEELDMTDMHKVESIGPDNVENMIENGNNESIPTGNSKEDINEDKSFVGEAITDITNIFTDLTSGNGIDMNETLNEGPMNGVEINEGETNKDEVNKDEINKSEINEGEINENKENEVQIKEDKINEDELNEDEVHEVDVSDYTIIEGQIRENESDENKENQFDSIPIDPKNENNIESTILESEINENKTEDKVYMSQTKDSIHLEEKNDTDDSQNNLLHEQPEEDDLDHGTPADIGVHIDEEDLKGTEENTNEMKGEKNLNEDIVDNPDGDKEHIIEQFSNEAITVVIDKQHSKLGENANLDGEQSQNAPESNEHERFDQLLLDDTFGYNQPEMDDGHMQYPTAIEYGNDDNEWSNEFKYKEDSSHSLIVINDFSKFSTITDIIRQISMNSFGENLPKPFPVLVHLDLSYNKVKQERALIPIIAWLGVKTLSIHNNPISLSKCQKSSFIKSLLEDTFKISVEWLKPISESKPCPTATRSKLRIVDTISSLPLKYCKSNALLTDPIAEKEKENKRIFPTLMPLPNIINYSKALRVNSEADNKLVPIEEYKSIVERNDDSSGDESTKFVGKNKNLVLRALRYRLEHPATFYERNVNLFLNTKEFKSKQKSSKGKKSQKMKKSDTISSVLQQQNLRSYETEIPLNHALNLDNSKGDRGKIKVSRIAIKAMENMQKKYNEVRLESLCKES